MHEVWDFGSNGITHDVHPTAQVDVSAGVVGHLLSDYLTENGRIILILSKISINGSIEYLGIPKLHRTGGTIWDDNWDPRSSWGEIGTTTNNNWVVYSGGTHGSVGVTWHVAVPDCSDYIPVSPENACTAACRVCDDHLQSRCWARIGSPSTGRNLVWNPRVNRRGDDQEGSVAK